jgi:cytochrome c oxidase assembly protein subunit 15
MRTRLTRFAWAVLAYNVAVITWGAYVRATGSGAGCGNHWPLCNGEVVPRAPELATLIEFSHRLTSGVALLAIAVLVVWIFRACAPGHPARLGAVLSGVLIVTEAAVGAGLVLFQLVADNATMARAMFVAVHLLNTFLLLGALTLTAWWLSVGRPFAAGRRPQAATVAAACAALLVAGASGAVAALGDTLFPTSSLSEALWADLSATSHFLIRLRVLHPVLAVGAGLAVLICAGRLTRGGSATERRGARLVTVLVAVQIALGLLNVLLLAPVWLQLVHLLFADAIWIGVVVVGARALTDWTPAAAAMPAAAGVQAA